MKIRIVRNNKVRFSGSEKAFAIWSQTHVLRSDDEFEAKKSFGSRGTVTRMLIPRIHGADSRTGNTGLQYSVFGCHSTRRGDGY